MNTTQFITICILIASFNFIWNYFSKNRSNITSGNPTPEHNESSVNAALEKPETSVLIFSTALALLPLLSGFWFLNGWLNEYNIAEDTMSWNAYPGVMLSKKITLNTNNNDTGHQLSGRTEDDNDDNDESSLKEQEMRKIQNVMTPSELPEKPEKGSGTNLQDVDF